MFLIKNITVLVLVLFLSSCLKYNIGPYSSAFQQSLSTLQQQVDTFLITTQQERQNQQYNMQRFQTDYQKIITSLDNLTAQAQTLHNQVAVKECQTLRSSLNDIYTMYTKKILDPKGVALAKETIDNQFLAMSRLEHSKIPNAQ